MKVDEVGPWTLLYWGEVLTHRDNEGKLLDPMAALARLFVGVVTSGGFSPRLFAEPTWSWMSPTLRRSPTGR